ncbi:MAG TPA: lasso peptide biosynthesis PqqD family chaperone [Bacteroidales bacterium]
MKPEITLQTTVRRNTNMVTSKIDDEIVMMSVENGEYYGLDPVGSRIWELIEKPIQIADLITTLMDEFEVERENCERDTFEFLKELNTKRLLEII